MKTHAPPANPDLLGHPPCWGDFEVYLASLDLSEHTQRLYYNRARAARKTLGVVPKSDDEIAVRTAAWQTPPVHTALHVLAQFLASRAPHIYAFAKAHTDLHGMDTSKQYTLTDVWRIRAICTLLASKGVQNAAKHVRSLRYRHVDLGQAAQGVFAAELGPRDGARLPVLYTGDLAATAARAILAASFAAGEDAYVAGPVARPACRPSITFLDQLRQLTIPSSFKPIHEKAP